MQALGECFSLVSSYSLEERTGLKWQLRKILETLEMIIIIK
jgi:hypothetical protein